MSLDGTQYKRCPFFEAYLARPTEAHKPYVLVPLTNCVPDTCALTCLQLCVRPACKRPSWAECPFHTEKGMTLDDQNIVVCVEVRGELREVSLTEYCVMQSGSV